MNNTVAISRLADTGSFSGDDVSARCEFVTGPGGPQGAALTLPVQGVEGSVSAEPALWIGPRPASMPAARFELRQKFEGQVLAISGEGFTARLEDVLGNIDDLDADFPWEDVPRGDWSLVVPGAVFYFSIGYAVDGGTLERRAVIRFRRLPGWTVPELQEAGA